MTTVQQRALEEIKKGKKFNGKLYGNAVYIGGEKWTVACKKSRATIQEFLEQARQAQAQAQTFDTGLGYYGNAEDMRRGYDGIESI